MHLRSRPAGPIDDSRTKRVKTRGAEEAASLSEFEDEDSEPFFFEKEGMAIEKDALRRVIEEQGPYAFHNTHPKNVPSILKNGLIPWDQDGVERSKSQDWHTGLNATLPRREQHVYLHTGPSCWSYLVPDDDKLMGFYGGNVSHPVNRHPCPIRIDMRKLDPSKFNVDDGGIKSDEKDDTSDDVYDSMTDGFSFSYKGTIPPEAIEVNPDLKQCGRCSNDVNLDDGIDPDCDWCKGTTKPISLTRYAPIRQYLKAQRKTASGKPQAIICDLDGTLASVGYRRFLVDDTCKTCMPEADFYKESEPDAGCETCKGTGRDPELTKSKQRNWTAFHDMSTLDSPVPDVVSLLKDAYDAGDHVVFSTGRPDIYRYQTQWWLAENLPWLEEYDLKMRKSMPHRKCQGTGCDRCERGFVADQRPDDVVKEEMYRESIEPNFDVQFAIDDRPSVIAKWKELGLSVIECKDPNLAPLVKKANLEKSPIDLMFEELDGQIKFHSPLQEDYTANPDALSINGSIYPTYEFPEGVKVGLHRGILSYRAERKQVYETADVRSNKNNIVIGAIHTPVELRGQGHASNALSHITDLADKHGVTLQLEPVPSFKEKGVKQPNIKQLIKFYSKFGFEPTQNAFDLMQRYPREQKTAAWADVRNKARRIRRSGGVEIVRLEDDVIIAKVKGDHRDYDVEIFRQYPSAKSVTFWTCSCFPPGTPVMMADGSTKPIEDVVEGDMVLTHEGRSRKVLRTMQREFEGNLIELTINGLPTKIQSTPEHPYLTANSDWGISHLKPSGQYYQGVKPSDLEPDFNTWKTAEELVVGDYVVSTPPSDEVPLVIDVQPNSFMNKKGNVSRTPSGKFYGRVRHNGKRYETLRYNDDISARSATEVLWTELKTLSVKIDESIAEILGWYIAEGFATKDSTGVGFALGPTEEHVARRLNDLLDSSLGVMGTIRKSETGVDFRVHSFALRSIVEQLVGKGVRTKSLHPDLMTLPTHLQQILMDAWCAGDGHVRGGRATIATASENLARQASLILSRLGYASVVRQEENPPGPQARAAGKTDTTVLWNVAWGIDRSRNRTDRIVEDGRTWRRVEDIRQVPYTGVVYNFEVEDDNTYLVDWNTTVHNCKWGEWAFKRQVTYVGRFCSHALATLYEAHSQEYRKKPVTASASTCLQECPTCSGLGAIQQSDWEDYHEREGWADEEPAPKPYEVRCDTCSGQGVLDCKDCGRCENGKLNEPSVCDQCGSQDVVSVFSNGLYNGTACRNCHGHALLNRAFSTLYHGSSVDNLTFIKPAFQGHDSGFPYQSRAFATSDLEKAYGHGKYVYEVEEPSDAYAEDDREIVSAKGFKVIRKMPPYEKTAARNEQSTAGMTQKFYESLLAKKDTRYLYHDISEPDDERRKSKFESIMKNGLMPRGLNGTSWGHSKSDTEPRSGFVYLADGYGIETLLDEGQPPYIRVDISKLDPTKFEADEDTYDKGWSYEAWEAGEMPSQGEAAEEAHIGHDPWSTINSLVHHHSIAYKGVIPPEALSISEGVQKVPQECNGCDGTGSRFDKECRWCYGTGTRNQTPKPNYEPDEDAFRHEKCDNPNCDDGFDDELVDECETCFGSGVKGGCYVHDRMRRTSATYDNKDWDSTWYPKYDVGDTSSWYVKKEYDFDPEVDERIKRTLDKLTDEYPITKSWFKGHDYGDIDLKQGGAFGCILGDGTIHLNKNEIFNPNSNIHFPPKYKTDKPWSIGHGIEQLTAHEFAHVLHMAITKDSLGELPEWDLENMMNDSYLPIVRPYVNHEDNPVKQITDEAKENNPKAFVSTYAQRDELENFAEAMLDHWTSLEPEPYSREIGSKIDAKYHRDSGKTASLNRKVVFNGRRGPVFLDVEVADTPSAIQTGLMWRSFLPMNQGMLFDFKRPTTSGFWMQNVSIPLSIAFIDNMNRIIDIKDMDLCFAGRCPSYAPDKPFAMAIEVNQGWFKYNGIDVGVFVNIT